VFALGAFSYDGIAFPGLVREHQVTDLRKPLGDDVTTLALLRNWQEALPLLHELSERGGLEWRSLDDLRPLPPVDPPGQILCAGANYRGHLEQMHFAAERQRGNNAPDEELLAASRDFVETIATKGEPFMFAGLAGALCGANDDVVLHGPGTGHDWELELAVVIGRPAWRVLARDAMEHVAGYTIANDVSTRDVMTRPRFPMTDFVASKLRPTFQPTGPYIVPTEFVADPRDLRIRLEVNGEAMQDESTSDIIFGVEELIAYASTMVALTPGDLLLTGSPAGNAGHHGDRWLVPGDVMTGTITGLGTQRNHCVAPTAY
jgi:2-keto-4-pentenoate hydratase/2-oxohepta-3-ene-1,7-dioic acid hydratase in catechol pathway